MIVSSRSAYNSVSEDLTFRALEHIAASVVVMLVGAAVAVVVVCEHAKMRVRVC